VSKCACVPGAARLEQLGRWHDAEVTEPARRLSPLRPHDLRHTAATIMLHDLKVPVKIVSEMLGHSSTTTTLEIYGHVLPGMQREAATMMGDLVRRNRGKLIGFHGRSATEA